MNYLLDTCCISELVKKKPNLNVLKWFDTHEERSMYLSVITFGELRKGIAKLPNSRKRLSLDKWVSEELSHRFKHRILPLNLDELNTWGKIIGNAERKGLSIPAIDALIAATSIVHNLTIVTRNIKDMQHTGAEVLNLWE